MSKSKYYNIRTLIKDYSDAYYYVVIGERSNGKTYSALDMAIENYFTKGEQFVYLRRFGEDVRRKTLSILFDGHIQNGRISKYSDGVYSLVDYTSGRFTPMEFDEEKRKSYKHDEPMGFAFDLNSMEHIKSTSFPKVTTIIFDEFLSRQGYLTNEFVIFMNMLSTIIRDRNNVKIIMLANTVNKYSPYFEEMGLKHIQEQKPGTVDVYKYSDTALKVVVEYCDPMSKRGGKKSDVYFAFDNPQLQMITGGTWEIAIYPHLPYKYRPKDIMVEFFVLFDRNMLHAEIVTTDEQYFMFVHPKTTPIKKEDDIIYSTTTDGNWNHMIGFSGGSDKLSLLVTKLLRENRVFYSDNETGEVLRNYIMWSQNYSVHRGGK